MRIDKLLAHCGYGSRKDVKQLLKDGVVVSNGKKIKSSGLMLILKKMIFM